MLLQKGVNVDARDEDGLSPLLLAVRGRYSGDTAVDVWAGAMCGVGLDGAAEGPPVSCGHTASPGGAGWAKDASLLEPHPPPASSLGTGSDHEGPTLDRVVKEGFLEEVPSKLSQAGSEGPCIKDPGKEKHSDTIEGVSRVFCRLSRTPVGLGWGAGTEGPSQHRDGAGIKQAAGPGRARVSSEEEQMTHDDRQKSGGLPRSQGWWPGSLVASSRASVTCTHVLGAAPHGAACEDRGC